MFISIFFLFTRIKSEIKFIKKLETYNSRYFLRTYSKHDMCEVNYTIWFLAIAVKFLLIISMLNQSERSRELRTRSPMEKSLDVKQLLPTRTITNECRELRRNCLLTTGAESV